MKIVFSAFLSLMLIGLLSAQDSTATKKKNGNASNQAKPKDIIVPDMQLKFLRLERKLDSIGLINKKLKYEHDTLAKYVNDKRLRQSLMSAESTINMQNSWLTGFGTIYTVITIIVAIISIVLIVINHNLSTQTREAIGKADDATNRLIERTDYINKTIDSEFQKSLKVYTEQTERDFFDNFFKKLQTNLVQTRALAYEELQSMELNRLTEIQVSRLYALLSSHLTYREKSIVVDVLIRIYEQQKL